MKLNQLALLGLVALAASVPLATEDSRGEIIKGSSLPGRNGPRDLSTRVMVPKLNARDINLITRDEAALDGGKDSKGGKGDQHGKKGKEGEESEGGEEEEEEEDEEEDEEEGEEGKEGGEGLGQGGQHGHEGR
ncbi:hypothetical protein ETB97_001931 [Aspergillus alliaceus]|uniref:Uncharacterized protein n=1 Tax=Petromyces alliaceus TaxID=209559 RepID=A0A8H6AFC5_PETAA|nr:hypothetical protein ETB97_001931 [Aspergillus burnettii]